MGLLKDLKQGSVNQKPRLPNYRKSGGLALATFTARSVKLKDEMLRFSLGTKVKAWFGIDSFYLPMPANLGFKTIREIRILPRNRQFYAEFVDQVSAVSVDIYQMWTLQKSPALK
ncbi:hypothetical protein VB735_04790 [Halotia wernerae UHCC 0503]|nr:hypothetical protein [Halotia wernerae UHCC 0503]